jgi:tripartite-type tricarboxylate transporter receptor subunit TctC
MKMWRALLLIFTLLVLPFEAALAQSWPSRPIRLVVPLPAGGAYDYIARLLADRLMPVLGVPIIVENKPGASAQIGTASVAQAPADGYTFLVMSNTHLIAPSLFKGLPYDPIKDFAPVSLIVGTPFVLVVGSQITVQTVEEYIAMARNKPGKLEYGSSGIGSPFHLSAELMKTMAGIDLLHVPYRGTNQLTQALLVGEVASAFVPIGPYMPYIEAGKLRPLAIVGTSRNAILPKLLTIAEAGPLPGYGIDSWLGMLAPAGTPREIIDRMNKAIIALLENKKFAEELLVSKGYEPIISTPEQFLDVMRRDLTMYQKIVRDANIPAQ